MKNYRKLVPLVLIILLVASWYLLVSETFEVNNEYETYLAEARKFAKDGITKYAIENYNCALEIKDSVELYVEVADYYKEYGKSREYLDWCKKFFEAYPTEVKAYEALLTAYMEQKDYESCYDMLYTAQKRGINSEYIEDIWEEIFYYYKLDYNTYEDVSVYSNNYCAVQKKDVWGFVDRYGNQRINCRYLDVSSYTKSNYVSVVSSDSEAYYIDKTGSKVVVMDDKYKRLGLYIDGIIAAEKNNGKYTYINQEGEVLFGEYDYASTVNNGVAAIKDGENWFIIDQQGNKLTDTAYVDIKLDEKEIAYRNDRLFVQTQAGSYIMIDSQGNQIGNGKYEDAKVFSSESYAAVKINGKWSFIDKDGNTISGKKYEDARSFVNGFAAVKINGKWGFVNENEELVIEAQFFDAKDFNEKGSCFVNTGDKWQLLKLYRLNREE